MQEKLECTCSACESQRLEKEERDFIHPALVLGTCILLAALILLFRGCETAWATEINIDMSRIAAIESSGNPRAHNKDDDSRGLYQLRKIVIDDYNQFHSPKIDFDEVWDPAINEQIARWIFEIRIPQYIRHYGLSNDLLTILAIYNWGIRNVVGWYKNGERFYELPLVTQKYYEKYAEK